jgi:type I restriction enzyme S subunit
VCPEANGVATDWLIHAEGAVSLPHEQIILRWTSAIKEKFEKLTGKPDRPEAGYLAKGVVAPDDVYVIAVNGRLLRNEFPQLSGISQCPFAVEVTLAVGPFSIHIDRNTLKTTWSGLQHRPLVEKPNGALVSANTFFNPAYVSVSGVWATDFDENVLFDASKPSILAHNHAASNPIPRLLLPVHSEYRATVGTNEYSVDRVDGRLAIVERSP